MCAILLYAIRAPTCFLKKPNVQIFWRNFTLVGDSEPPHYARTDNKVLEEDYITRM